MPASSLTCTNIKTETLLIKLIEGESQMISEQHMEINMPPEKTAYAPCDKFPTALPTVLHLGLSQFLIHHYTTRNQPL